MTLKLLITAGPTREPIDAVRFVGNRSSGRLGIALAQAGCEAGHDVTLLLGPGPEDQPLRSQGVRVYRFESSAELKQLLEAHFHDCQVLIMAAAVADYRPMQVHEGKLPRQADGSLTITLSPTPDLVALMAQRKRADQRVIAFALEQPEQLEARAKQKMQRKHVDAIVANPLGTMDASGITAKLMRCDGQVLDPGRLSKSQFGRWLMDQLDWVRCGK